LGVGGVEGVRERERGEEIMARLPRVSPLPYVHWLEDKENKRETEMLAGERERGGRLGLHPWSILQRERESDKGIDNRARQLSTPEAR
jgi:hypothetical protein